MASQFGQKVRELRIGKGLGLREAAGKAGIDPGLWSKYETGARRPPNPTTKSKDAERVILAIAKVVETDQHDPYPELLALATLPDDAPPDTIQSLSKHYTRRTKKRKG
jgi:transcriptional regulator with XRE-family HTH domain